MFNLYYKQFDKIFIERSVSKSYLKELIEHVYINENDIEYFGEDIGVFKCKCLEYDSILKICPNYEESYEISSKHKDPIFIGVSDFNNTFACVGIGLDEVKNIISYLENVVNHIESFK